MFVTSSDGTVASLEGPTYCASPSALEPQLGRVAAEGRHVLSRAWHVSVRTRRPWGRDGGGDRRWGGHRLGHAEWRLRVAVAPGLEPTTEGLMRDRKSAVQGTRVDI